ncbi:unnamed protein product [Caenorhabditis sp. 36 PRJEB53466]|nr:unnamed protein product [Caenorhabditis sp. 36 PRJEB53466]
MATNRPDLDMLPHYVDPLVEPFILHVFEPGFRMVGQFAFMYCGYKWTVQAFMTEKDKRFGIDIELRVSEIPPGEHIYAVFAFQQLGNEKHQFEFEFDNDRGCYYYRRALTIPKVTNQEGIVGCHYSHYRFLRRREDDETHELSEEQCLEWKPEIPPMSELEEGGATLIDCNENFMENIKQNEGGLSSFQYYFHLIAVLPHRGRIPEMSMFWPKASKTAVYLNNRSLGVDKIWFASWASFDRFMSNVDLLPPKDFESLIEVLGHYYHAWHIKHPRLIELVKIAERFGFYDFPQTMLAIGDFQAHAASMRSILVANKDHPLFKIDTKLEAKVAFEETHKLNFDWIFHESSQRPPEYRMFKTRNRATWSMSVVRRTFNKTEYLCVAFVLNYRFQPTEHQLWKFELAPFCPNSPKQARLPNVTHMRVFNSVQKMIVFPVCYPWSDVVKEMGEEGPFDFHVKLTLTPLPGWDFEEVAGGHPATGHNTAFFDCYDGAVEFNKDYLQETCLFLRNWEENEYIHCADRVDMPFHSKDEVIHLLDHLYHGCKLYNEDTFVYTAALTKYIKCGVLSEALERGLIRTKPSENVLSCRSLPKNECSRFHRKMKDVLGIIPLDEYLESSAEPLAR